MYGSIIQKVQENRLKKIKQTTMCNERHTHEISSSRYDKQSDNSYKTTSNTKQRVIQNTSKNKEILDVSIHVNIS